MAVVSLTVVNERLVG